MKTLQYLGLFFILASFLTTLAILSASTGVTLPKSDFTYWLFWGITSLGGVLLLFSTTPWKKQMSPLRWMGSLQLLTAAAATLLIVGDLLGIYIAQKYFTLWFFFVFSGVVGAICIYFAHDLSNSTTTDSLKE